MSNPIDRARDPRRVPEYRTEVDKTSQQRATQDTDIITKSAYKEKHGWVSAWPTGHPNHSSVVSKEEQTENVRRQNGY
jgi:hypothetical protein